MTPNKFLFISYARADGEFALRLAQDLREAGIAIWLDQLDIPSGARWDSAIQQALDSCASMLVILSPDSVSSENVLDEIGFALHKKKHIVPVLYRTCDIPFRLLRFQYVDFTEGYERGLRELLEDLQKMGLAPPRATKPATPPRPEPKPEKIRPPEKKPEPGVAPPSSTLSPQKAKPAFALRRYAIPFALVAVLALVIWKGVDWSGFSAQEPPAKKKTDDSSATQREGRSSVQPKSSEPSTAKKPDDTSTETKRENKPAPPNTTSEQHESARVRTTPPGMVLIRGGAFLMGSDDGDSQEYEKPLHTVIVNDFYLDEREVTVADYQNFLSETSHAPPPQWPEQLRNPDHPVVNVSWNDAKAYARSVDKRLPYEAEWEYAARGGNTGLNNTPHYKFPWGDEASHERANYHGAEGRDRWNGTAPVKSFPATGFGLYDMAGNVWEWCEDWYDENYYKSRPNPDRDPKGPNTGNLRVLRGGSWSFIPPSMRCAGRDRDFPTIQNYLVGIRCAQDALR